MNIFDNIIITAIDDVFMVPSPKGRYMEMKNRVDFGLSFCKDGQITYDHNGQKTVSDRWHAVILPQGGCYTLWGDETGVFPLINFRTTAPFTEKFISVRLENPQSYIKEAEHMQSLLSTKNKTKLFSVMYGILDRLKSEAEEKNMLEPAVKYMESRFSDEGLSNAELARQLNISEVYFRRLFKEKYNTTPHKYLLRLRIEKAKQLLCDRGRTVSAVAEACGFSGVYHFCKAFKAATGTTPTAFRRSLEEISL